MHTKVTLTQFIPDPHGFLYLTALWELGSSAVTSAGCISEWEGYEELLNEAAAWAWGCCCWWGRGCCCWCGFLVGGGGGGYAAALRPGLLEERWWGTGGRWPGSAMTHTPIIKKILVRFKLFFTQKGLLNFANIVSILEFLANCSLCEILLTPWKRNLLYKLW